MRRSKRAALDVQNRVMAELAASGRHLGR